MTKISRLTLSLAALQIGIFFLALNTVSTDFSGGDLSWLHQRLYNFWNGRGFQTSVYRLASPISYAHDFANHLIITPLFMAFPYKFLPNLNTFFALAIAYNLGSLFFFSRLFLGKTDAAAYIPLLFVMWGPFFKSITHQCHPILFAAPLFLASYYFARKGAWLPFLAMVIAVSLVQDDCGLWMACYCAYFVWVEGKRNWQVVAGGIFGLALFMVYGLYIQPSARWYADHAASVDLVTSMNAILVNWTPESLPWTLKYYAIFLAEMTFPALVLYAIRHQVPKRMWAFLALAPLPYWVTFLTTRAAAHHYAAIVWVLFIVMIEVEKGEIDGFAKEFE